MKAGLLSFAGLSALAVAQPHRQDHRHLHKKDVVYDVVTETEMATATAPNAVVYVDHHGAPMWTSWGGRPDSYPTEAPAAPEEPTDYAPAPEPTSESSSYVAPAPTTTEAPAPSSYAEETQAPAPSSYSEETQAPAPSSSAEETSSSAPAPTSAPDSGSGHAGISITYSPYNADGTCKDQDQVNMDFEQINGYGMVRTYGTDCNQTATVLNAASAKGMKLFAGIFDINDVSGGVSDIIDATNGDWSSIHTVSVGNEGVNNGQYSVDQVVSALNSARGQLSSAGYNGNVVTVDTFVAMIANPQLCEASDYAAANCHAFFDGGVTAEEAGDFVVSQAQRVSEACGGKNTMITESGWPSQGESNDKAVPSEENQRAAISSLKGAFSDNLILFNAFNDQWKSDNSGTFGAEKFWGMYGNAPSS